MRVQKTLAGNGILDQISGVVRDTGGILMDTGRGVLSLAKSARGDTPDTVVSGAAPVSYSNLTVYGVLAAVALFMVVKK